jgi:hypothetical protein
MSLYPLIIILLIILYLYSQSTQKNVSLVHIENIPSKCDCQGKGLKGCLKCANCGYAVDKNYNGKCMSVDNLDHYKQFNDNFVWYQTEFNWDDPRIKKIQFFPAGGISD